MTPNLNLYDINPSKAKQSSVFCWALFPRLDNAGKVPTNAAMTVANDDHGSRRQIETEAAALSGTAALPTHKWFSGSQ
jgi:hypothetical protein